MMKHKVMMKHAYLLEIHLKVLINKIGNTSEGHIENYRKGWVRVRVKL